MNSTRKTMKGGNGRWTKSEHERFLKGLERYGRDWFAIQKVVKTRSLIQIRSHAQKVFLKMSDADIRSLIGSDCEFQTPSESNSRRCPLTESSSEEEAENYTSILTVQQPTNLLDIFRQALEIESQEANLEPSEDKPSLNTVLELPESDQESPQFKCERQTANINSNQDVLSLQEAL